jgi:hypothetical protein
MWWCVCGARRIAGKLKLPRQAANAVYFNCVEIELNVVFSFVPRPFTTAMIAIEMPAAIRPYSMAVAADSSCKKAVELRQHDQILGGR